MDAAWGDTQNASARADREPVMGFNDYKSASHHLGAIGIYAYIPRDLFDQVAPHLLRVRASHLTRLVPTNDEVFTAADLGEPITQDGFMIITTSLTTKRPLGEVHGPADGQVMVSRRPGLVFAVCVEVHPFASRLIFKLHDMRDTNTVWRRTRLHPTQSLPGR